MKSLIKLTSAILPLLVVAIGCSKLIPGQSNLFEGDNAAKAAAAIKAKAGTERVSVIRVEVRPDKMVIVTQSPTNSKEQDEYTYERGSASGPKPVQIHKVFAQHIPHTTEIGEINFAGLPATIKRGIELAESPGGKVDLVSMDNQYANTATPSLKDSAEGKKWSLTWRIFVQSSRIQNYFWADTQGKLNEKAY